MSMYSRFVNLSQRDNAFRLVVNELYKLEDPDLLVIKSHLIIESILFTNLRNRVAHKSRLIEAGLSFRQLFHLARAFRERDSQPWVWDFITKLNRLRNDSTHELRPKNQKRIEELCEFARPFLRITPDDRLIPDLRKTLIMAIVVIHNLLAPTETRP